LLFGSSLRWGSVYIGSAGDKALNSRVACGVDQPFLSIGIDRIPIRAHVGAPLAARLAGEPRFYVGKPNIIRSSIGADGCRMAAAVVRAIDQDTTHAAGAHLAEGDLLLADGFRHGP
jgi:hypothetical protein